MLPGALQPLREILTGSIVLFAVVAAAGVHLDAFIRAELLKTISIIFCRKISAKPPQISPLLLAHIKLSAILRVTVKMSVYSLLAIKMLIWLCYKLNPILNNNNKKIKITLR